MQATLSHQPLNFAKIHLFLFFFFISATTIAFAKNDYHPKEVYYYKYDLPVNITFKGQDFPISDFSIVQSTDSTFVKIYDLQNGYIDEQGKLKFRVECNLIINGKQHKGKRAINCNLTTGLTIFKFATSANLDAVVFYPGDNENKRTIIKLTATDVTRIHTPLQNNVENNWGKIDKTESATVKVKFENTIYKVRIGKIGRDDKGYRTIELLGDNLGNIPFINGNYIVPVEMNIVVNGEIITRENCVAGKSYLFQFDTKEKPEKIIIFGNDGTNSSIVTFDGTTKKVLKNKK